MVHLLLWIFLVLLLDNAQFRICKPNYNNPYCTFGAIDNINKRVTYAPMSYRVLNAWIIRLIESFVPQMKQQRLMVYELLKMVSMVFALSCVEYALGLERALLVATMIPVTFQFDYIDCYYELAAFAAALSGNWQLTLFAGMLLAFERETAPLIPITFYLVTGDGQHTLGIIWVIALVMLCIRLYVGYKKLYCDRFMYKRNWQNLKDWFTKPYSVMLIDHRILSLILSILTIWYICSGQVIIAAPMPLVVILLSYTMGIAAETRILMPLTLWLAMGIIK
jgi:hypothetical protein